MAGITVKIGGCDMTEYVDARTLSIRDELTSKVNSASFDFICNNIAVAPKSGRAVLIEEGTKKLFSGRILSIKESFLPPNLLKYPVECVDYTRDLDKKLVAEFYQNQKAGDIYKHIIDKYTKVGTPTGHNDPDSQWVGETKAYDNNLVTQANNDIAPESWGNFLELTISPILCSSVRFYAWYSATHISSIDLDVYYDDAWHHVYQGAFADREWVVKDLGEIFTVTKARLKFYNSFAAPSGSSLYEFNFIASDPGFTTNNVSDGPTISEITFDYVQVSDALTKIAEICGYEWYVDYDKDVHFFDSSLNPAPFQLDDDQANYKDLVLNKNISQLRNRIYIKSSAIKDTFGEVFIWDGITTSWVCKYKAEIMLPEKIDTDTLRWYGTAVEFSHNDIYLAVGLDWVLGMPQCPDIRIFKRDGDIFTKIDNPNILPTGNAFGVGWSSDDTYLAVGHQVSPYITIYKRNEDVFTKLDDPVGGFPAGNGNGLSFGYNDTYLAISHKDFPYITIYKRAGDVFTKLGDPVDKPTGDGQGASFSPNGIYLAVAHTTFPYVTIYKRDEDVFTKLQDPAIPPTGDAHDVAFSPDGIYLAVGHTTTPFITIYKRFGDTFTKLTDPPVDDLPKGLVNGVAFAPNSTHLAAAHDNSPYMTLYKRGGDTFVKMDDPSPLPTGDGLSAAFSYNNRYLAIGHQISPRLTIYKHFVPLVTVDGVYKTVGWDGIDNSNYFDYMLNPDTKVLSIGTAGIPPIDIGSPAIEQEGSVLKEFTHIGKENPANASGKINKVEIWAYENLLNTIVATFTQVAESVFTARDSQYIGTVISGSKQIFSVDLEVAEGDFIGIYFTSGMCMMHFAGAGRWALYGDQSSCSEATFNFTADRTISLYGTGSTIEGELTVGAELLIIYTTYGRSICFRRDDKASITDRIEKEGGDGIIEFCIVDNDINSIFWANEVVKADLSLNAFPTIRGTFITNRNDIHSGQVIVLNSTKRNINQQFIVQSVELVRVDVITEWPTVPYKPAAEAEIGYKPASEAEKGYRAAGDSGGIIYYIFNITIANKFKKLEDLFIHLLTRTDESLK